MKEVVIKNRKIISCTVGPSKGGWMYEIVSLRDKNTYRADLWGYSDDYDYLTLPFAVQESSPEFATAEEAEAFAQREWIIA